MNPFLTAVCITVLLSCNEHADSIAKTDVVPPAFVYNKEPADSSRYTHVKYSLYTDSTGKLYEKKFLRGDSSCHCEFIVKYESNFRIWTEDADTIVPLSSIIDINTYTEIDHTQYSKDKNRVYYFHGTSDGGVRQIVEGADPGSFKRLAEYRWGIDRKNVYYKNNVLPDLDVKTLRVLYPADTSNYFVDYVKDQTVVYCAGERVKGADAKTFKLAEEQKWDAEDKHRKYQGANVYR